jgi:hypothetical protein
VATEKAYAGGKRTLDGFLNAATTQAAGTHPHALRHAVYLGPYALKIGMLYGLGLDIRMAHLVTDEPSLVTDFAPVGHGLSTNVNSVSL